MTASELIAGNLSRDGILAAVPGDTWLSDRSWNRPRWTISELEAAKAGRTISVVLPALNEEETIESVIDSISPLVRGSGGLVDELIVLDSGSTDDTEIRAIAAGARVVGREQAVPELPTRPGKGEALWRSLAATSGDIVVFIDSDLINPHPMFVPHLVGPLLTGEGIHLVKGFYRRPLQVGDASGNAGSTGGGRGENHARHSGRKKLAHRKLAQDVVGRLADRVLLIRPGRVDAVVTELRKMGHTPQVLG